MIPGEITGASIEQGIVKEKKIPDGCYWWVYRVESVTRDGLKSLWMESIDVWEHVRDPSIPYGGNQTGYAVGTKVYFFLFDDGRGLILNRIEDKKDDFKARIGVFAETMAKVIEKEDQILAGIEQIKAMISGSGTGSISYGLSALSSQISNAQSSIEGKVANAQTALSGDISGAKTSIEGKVAEVKTAATNITADVTAEIGNAKNSIEGKLDGIKSLEDTIWAKVETL